MDLQVGPISMSSYLGIYWICCAFLTRSSQSLASKCRGNKFVNKRAHQRILTESVVLLCLSMSDSIPRIGESDWKTLGNSTVNDETRGSGVTQNQESSCSIKYYRTVLKKELFPTRFFEIPLQHQTHSLFFLWKLYFSHIFSTICIIRDDSTASSLLAIDVWSCSCVETGSFCAHHSHSYIILFSGDFCEMDWLMSSDTKLLYYAFNAKDNHLEVIVR